MKPQIPLFKVYMPKEVDEPLLDVLHSGYITQGKKVDEFEEKFEDVTHLKNAVSVNSGTSALTLALKLAGVGQGDSVVTTPMTCTATNLPILNLGAAPIFADVNSETGLITPATVEKLIQPNTKAIMAVDWGGLPVDVVCLQKIADKHGIKLIVDAAHALGTRHNAQPDFLCYSLQAIKHITVGDGGVLVCKDKDDAHRAKTLRWFGIDRTKNGLDSRIEQDIEEAGYKMHMNDLNATIGIVQLDHIEKVVNAHQINAAYYTAELDDYFIKPPFEGATWLYTILLPTEKDRDDFKVHMEKRGIAVNQVHKRNDHYTVFKPYAVSAVDGSQTYYKVYPGVDAFSQRMICIPVHWDLSMVDLANIVSAANDFAKERKS